MNSSFETSGSLPYPPSLPAAPRSQPVLHPPAAQNLDSRAVPWWLWWNILSLDAPMVAVVWQVFLGREAGAAPSAAESAILALTVWLIYVADHLLDACARMPFSLLGQRHLFCFRHRRLIIGLMLLTAAAIVSLSVAFLSAAELKSGFKLAAVVLAYLIAVHALRLFTATSAIKELAVGFTFAAGVMLSFWSRASNISVSFFPPFLLLALLCTLNCLVIESCEATAVPNCERYPIRRGARLNRFALILALAAFSTLLFGGFHHPFAPAFLTVSSAAALLLLLHSLKDSVSSVALRVLADVALFLPPAVGLALSAK